MVDGTLVLFGIVIAGLFLLGSFSFALVLVLYGVELWLFYFCFVS
jgi:hypothetical protein